MRRIPMMAAIAMVLGALVLAGCGGSSGGSTESSTTTASAGGSEGTAAAGGAGGAKVEISEEARKCLKEKGVELPAMKSGSGPPSGGSGEAPEAGAMPEGGPPEGMPEGGEAPEGMPEGGPPSGGAMNEESKEAFEECGVETPEPGAGGAPGGGAPNTNSAAFRKQVKQYVACVRKNGYELAEPDFSGEGPIFEKSESESAAFKKASAKCSSLVGGPAGGGGESEA